MVHGQFPFKDSSHNDYYYDLLINKKYDKYWKETNGQYLSNNFKDLFIKMTSYNPEDRPTIEDIMDHPWMTMQQEACDIQTTSITECDKQPTRMSSIGSEETKESLET